MRKITLAVRVDVGLHARPAALFVKEAGRFESEISVRNCTTGSEWADAKSILSVLSLGVERDHEIELEVDGPDEAEAIEAFSALVGSNFGEDRKENG